MTAPAAARGKSKKTESKTDKKNRT